MKNRSFLVPLVCISTSITLPVHGQQAPVIEKIYTKTLPEDLPTSKLLLIKFRPAAIPTERPDNMTRRNYKLLEQHAINYPHANEQLEKAASHYPFAYRITTQDSTTYYYEHGYKYVLFHRSFNAFTEGYFRGSNSSSSTSVDLYIKDLSSGDRYIVNEFSETFIYYYKGLIGMLLKRVEKQFKVKK